MSAAADTKEQILDVAEAAIAERGYAGTTLRSIVNEANVNLAAVHYHFGSKEALMEALVARISTPIVKTQLASLAALQAQGSDAISAEAILRAYLSALDDVIRAQATRPHLAKFIGRCRTEPTPVQCIAAEQFDVSTSPYLDALQRVLPDQSRSQLRWKLDLVVSCLIRMLVEAGKPDALLRGTTDEDIEKARSQLVTFLLPGLIAT